MGVIWTSRTRNRQPQGVAQVNRSNPIARGLLAIQVATQPTRNLANDKENTLVNLGFGSGLIGKSFVGNGVDSRVTGQISVLAGTPFSIFAIATTNTVSGTRNIASIGSGSAYALQLRQDGANWSFYVATGTDALAGETGGVTAGVVNVVAGTNDGVNVSRFYRGGVERGSNTGTGAPARSATTMHVLGDFFGANQAWSGGVYLVALWNRELSAAEVRALSDNPWQLFAPERRPVFYSLPAAGGTSSAVVWNARTRTSQPQGVAPLSSNSLQGGLTPILIGQARRGRWKLRSRSGLVLSDVGTPAFGVDPYFGSILQPTSGNYVRISGMPNTGYPFTVAMFARKNRTNGAGANRSFTFGPDDFGSYQPAFFHQDNTAYSYYGGGAGASLSGLSTDWTLVVCVFESDTSRTLINVKGGVLTSASNTDSISLPSWPLKLSIGQSGWNTDEWFGGDIALPMFFKGAMSTKTALLLAKNPWQLFAPERRPVFYSVGSGANTYAVGISETATASETVSMLASFGASISETVTASETVAMRATFGAAISETATASETVSMAASFVVTIGETATASETVAMALGAATFAVDISETATASETVSMLAAFGTSISETATASDLVSMLATFLVGISETATASETVAMQLANQTYAVAISETATASDTVVMTIPTTYAISIIETVQAGDYVSMGVPSSDFWTQVTTTQSAGWGQINNTQSSGWTIIPTT